MASKAIETAVKAADALRKRWGAGNRPAEKLFELAGKNDVLVFRLAIDPALSGLFLRSQLRKASIIVVNTSGNPLYRQRFTLGHELGHLELHQDLNALVDVAEPNQGDEREYQANTFTAQLLVPLKELVAVLRSYAVDPKVGSDRLVVELARAFGVSHEVILWRLRILGDLGATEVQDRITKTDWPEAWQAYARGAYKDAMQQREPNTWKADGVSAGTCRQISRLPDIYREMAFEAYQRREITAGKLAEILGLKDKRAVLDELAPVIDPEQAKQNQELEAALATISKRGRRR